MELLRYVLWLLLFLAAAGAVGALALRVLRRWVAAPGWLERVAIGLVLESFVLFALAVAQAWRVPILLGGFGVAAIAGIGLAVRAVVQRPAGAGAVSTPWWLALPAAALAAVVTAALAIQFLVTCFPSVAWDAATYHLALPRLYLQHGGFREVPLNLYSNWPLAGEMLYGLAMAVHDYVLAKLVHWAIAALLVAVLVRSSGKVGRAWGWMAAALVLANPVVGEQIGDAYVDLFVALFFLLGFLALEDALESGDRRRTACAGLYAGMAGVTKPSGALVAVCLGLFLAWRLWRARPRAAAAARELAAFGLPVLLCATPWLLKAWWYTGNPLYPFLYGWLDGRGWSATLAEQATRWQRSIGMGRTLHDFVVLPLRVILSGGKGYAHFDGALGAVWLAALPVGLAGAMVSARVRRALAVGGLYFAGWAATSQQMRLLVPALPLFALAAAWGAAEWTGRAAPRWRPALAGAAALGALLALGGPTAAAAPIAIAHAAEVEAFGMPRLREEIVPPVFRWIAAHTDPGARILMVNTNKVFFCPRPALADSMFEASQLADWLRDPTSVDGVAAKLRAAGVTHVLVEHVNWGIVWPEAFRALLADPRRARPVYRSPEGRFTLLELRLEPAAARP